VSLTSQLKKSQSPVSRFMVANFPNVKSLIVRFRDDHMHSTTILPPQAVIASVPMPQTNNVITKSYPYMLIGTAVDYRLRYYFSIPRSRSLLAYEGAKQAYGMIVEYEEYLEKFEACYDPPRGLTKKLTEEIFSSLDQLVKRSKPVKRLIAEDDERLLARYCVILGAFEQIARSGVMSSPVLLNPARRSLPALLASVDERWVNDLCTLSQAFYDACGALINHSQSIWLNPVFTGSVDVGGADGDIVADRCLIDIKTTIKPLLNPKWLYQLLGYVLLDYDNKYNLDSVAVYMARQQSLKKWGLTELMYEMSAGKVTDINVARNSFRNEINGDKSLVNP
jgi:hypothetical protein